MQVHFYNMCLRYVSGIHAADTYLGPALLAFCILISAIGFMHTNYFPR